MAVAVLTDEQLRAIMREELASLHEKIARLEARGSRPAPAAPTHIDLARLTARLGRGKSTIGDWERAGYFPAHHKCGGRRCWMLTEVEAWEAERRAPAGSHR